MCTDFVIKLKNKQQMYKLIFHYQGKNAKVWILFKDSKALR